MRILLHTMATPALDPVGALDFAQRLGLDGVDLILQRDYRCGLSPDTAEAEAPALAQAAAERGVPIRSLTPYLKALNVPDDGVRAVTVEAFEQAIRVAAALGARTVRVLAGYEVPADQWDFALALLVDALRRLGDYGAERGVALNIENHDGSMAVDAVRTMEVWRAVGHPNVGVIYDPANLIRDGMEGVPESLDLQAEAIRLIHVKDYIFSPEYPNNRRAMPIGDGVIPWMEILRGLHRIGYDGDLSIEYETRWVPEQLPDPAIGLARSRDHLRECLESLGRESLG